MQYATTDSLGTCYKFGIGVDPDMGTALKLFTKTAEMEHSEAKRKTNDLREDRTFGDESCERNYNMLISRTSTKYILKHILTPSAKICLFTYRYQTPGTSLLP